MNCLIHQSQTSDFGMSRQLISVDDLQKMGNRHSILTVIYWMVQAIPATNSLFRDSSISRLQVVYTHHTGQHQTHRKVRARWPVTLLLEQRNAYCGYPQPSLDTKGYIGSTASLDTYLYWSVYTYQYSVKHYTQLQIAATLPPVPVLRMSLRSCVQPELEVEAKIVLIYDLT